MADACWALCILGRPDHAIARSQETVALARELEHAFTVVIALHIPAGVYLHLQDIEGLARSLPEYMESARRMGNPVYITLGEALEGWLLAATTDGLAGAARVREARERFLGMGVELTEPLLATMAADACLRSGEIDVGLAILDEMLTKAHWKQQTSHLAEQHRLRGELLLAASAGNSAKAEECFVEALTVAEDQSALLFALRAAMSHGRLLQSRGQVERARSLVRGVYEQFTEGFDTPDLRLATAFLGQPTDSDVEIPRR
jgi:predicted ATPase